MRLFNVCCSLLSAVVVLMPLSGCVVWDINDGILASNDNLGRIEDELQGIDQGLSDTNDNLTATKSRLDSMDSQLMSLQTQLDATNTHLESLRKTINNIDSTIPFLNLSGDDEEEQKSLESGEPIPVDNQPEATPDPGKPS